MHTQPQQTVAKLRKQLEAYQPTPTLLRGDDGKSNYRSSGLTELDRLLPAGGFRPGELVEWIADEDFHGAAMVSLLAARDWLTPQQPALLIERRRGLFPPALAAAGFDFQSLVEVTVSNDRDLLWSWEQALGCSAVGLVWGALPHVAPLAYRRLKLAAETSGTIGFILRTTRSLRQPTWADFRLSVKPLPSIDAAPRFRICRTSRDGETGRSVDFELHDSGSLRRVGWEKPQQNRSAIPIGELRRLGQVPAESLHHSD
ncbi:MAG: hypothetical protein NXI22_14040 [bacterium]|nr:hypothetical protein [bacterium]